MCQLFGVSSATPIRLTFDWSTFALRGSEAGGNPDGWGVAYFTEGDWVRVREPRPAAGSVMVEHLARHAPAASVVISHVRRAVGSALSLGNTHPFQRVLGGRAHVFAHNGYSPGDAPPGAWLRPVGDTDSERLFCRLLEALEPLWRDNSPPSLASRHALIAETAAAARRRGAANFLYSDGITLFAHGHRRTLPGDAVSAEPGLYWREVGDSDGSCEGVTVSGRCPAVAEIATRPLDRGNWQAMAAGELLCFENGRRVAVD